MNSRLVTISLSLAVVLTFLVFLGSYTNTFRLPGNHEGYEPVQPIAYSHLLHAGELGISCQFCHSGAERGRTAGIPSVSTCMSCHRFVTAPLVDVKAEEDRATTEGRTPARVISPEIRKLYDALGLDDDLKPDPQKKSAQVEWIKVHTLPDFVYFNHSAHVNAGVDCQTCHGAVETMERVRQVSDLSMGTCVNCHRDATAKGIKGRPMKASTDCIVCHY